MTNNDSVLLGKRDTPKYVGRATFLDRQQKRKEQNLLPSVHDKTQCTTHTQEGTLFTTVATIDKGKMQVHDCR